MGWERRGLNGVYFYKSVRRNGLPRKVYYGRGRAAETFARLEAQQRKQRQAERAAFHAEQALVAPALHALRVFSALVDLLAKATLLLAEYHEHHRCWRRRHGSTEQGSPR
jgi:hypothetical protein